MLYPRAVEEALRWWSAFLESMEGPLDTHDGGGLGEMEQNGKKVVGCCMFFTSSLLLSLPLSMNFPSSTMTPRHLASAIDSGSTRVSRVRQCLKSPTPDALGYASNICMELRNQKSYIGWAQTNIVVCRTLRCRRLREGRDAMRKAARWWSDGLRARLVTPTMQQATLMKPPREFHIDESIVGHDV